MCASWRTQSTRTHLLQQNIGLILESIDSASVSSLGLCTTMKLAPWHLHNSDQVPWHGWQDPAGSGSCILCLHSYATFSLAPFPSLSASPALRSHLVTHCLCYTKPTRVSLLITFSALDLHHKRHKGGSHVICIFSLLADFKNFDLWGDYCTKSIRYLI